jgi:hypothetical protein
MLVKRDCLLQTLFVQVKLVAVLLSASLCHNNEASAQSTNISGIINTYHNVVEIIPAKSCVRVGSTVGLSVSETVMIIQMKGATVQTNNNSSFGDTTSLNNAGNYELSTICGINGDSVFLFFSLLNNYTISGKVQLIGIPTYYSAVVTSALSAQPWDNITGTGGVIALNVDEDLTLNAPISADGIGFTGGAYLSSNSTCSNFTAPTGYAYNANNSAPQDGAFKGESVYDITDVNLTGGRGAPANGGGGGNNHNNGGGGGANLTNGGDGGGNSSSTGCTTNLKGLGGKPLSSWAGVKIFFGGGGGAGHSNNGSVSTGGSGGGIVFIRTKNLIANNTKITANGNAGGNSNSDGAGGGGGGGTIISNVVNYSGTLGIEVKGGSGGISNDGLNIKRCYGAGGGGSGGIIYFNSGIPAATITVTGGVAGAETGRDPACNAIVPAGAGNNGVSVSNYTYSTSLNPSNICSAVPLPLSFIYFKAILSEPKKVTLQWRVTEPEAGTKYIIEQSSSLQQWKVLNTIPATNYDLYTYIDNSPLEGISFYRLKIIEPDNSISYSPLQKINIAPFSDKIKLYPNPAKDLIMINGELPGETDITLTSADGRMIFATHVLTNRHNLQLHLPSVAAGIYFLKINNQVKKLIIE